MADSAHTGVLAFEPMVCEQKAAAPFGESVNPNWSPTTWCLLDQAFVAATKKIGMKLTATTNRQAPTNFARVMPVAITKRLEHQALQFTAFSHRAILPAFVSTLLFVKGTSKKPQSSGRNAKSLHFVRGFASEFVFPLFPLFLTEKVCKQCLGNITY